MLARQLGKSADALRMRFGNRDSTKALDAAYEAPGSFWRLHLKGQLCSVDVKLPGIEKGDQTAADHRVELAGLEVTWLMSMEPEIASAEVLLFRPKGGTGKTQEPKPSSPTASEQCG